MSNYKLLWNRKGKLNKNNEGRLEFRIYLDVIKENIFVSTGISVKENDFNKLQWVVLKSNFNYRAHNKKLRSIQDRLDDTLSQLDKETSLNKDLFWRIYDPKKYRKKNSDKIIESFTNFNEFFITQLDKDIKFNNITKSTYDNIKQSYDKLNEWNDNVLIEDINNDFAEEFYSFLIDLGHGEGYRKKLFSNLSKYVLRLVKKELILHSKYLAFKDIDITKAKSEKHALNSFHLNKIIDLDYKPFSKLDISRDYFLMTAFTGLRYIDISKTLTREDIIINNDEVWLKITPQKVKRYNTEVNLPLHILFDGKPKEIVLKYIDLINPKSSENIFPFLRNKDLNKNLKTIEDDASIKYHLTHHIGRHTFITNLSILLKDPDLVMNLAGIKDIKTLENYIHIDHSVRNKRLLEINWEK